jgi:outer membrane protein assembly factor BamB
MTDMQTDPSTRKTPLRLWPGVAIVVLTWLGKFGIPIIMPDAASFAVISGVLGGLGVVVWWLFFSRAPWLERLSAIILMAVGLIATPQILHQSIRTAGMGISFFILAIPVLSLALVVWAVASRNLTDGPRRATMAATILLAGAAFALIRTDGITGDGAQLLAWRWTETAEDRLLAQADDEPTAPPPTPARAEMEVDWSGFRGPARDSVIRGVRIDPDWSRSPPIELWRRPIGPGWSSFAVHGGLLYTQEQRGEHEVVTCYDATTGEPVWRHRDAVRFWESHAGAGPRATPTLKDDRIYAFGATGILNALDAADGSQLWSRDAASDTSAEVPHWGFTSSPLVVGDLVIVDTGTLVAYDLDTGEPRWFGPVSNVSYSSPHLVTLAGVAQVLLLNGAGAISVAPVDGTLLWEYPWPGTSIVQPALTEDGDLLISATGAAAGVGTRRLAVTSGPGGWITEERWTSTRLKPYFSDFVVHDGHAYGFDGRILASIDLEDGKRNWKGGRYGHGQLVLLPDQDALLVVSEQGALALVAATPDRFTELARHPALEGKTWNHPVVVGDTLLVRNDQEMVAFRLTLANG